MRQPIEEEQEDVSRATISAADARATGAREALRQQHGVRLVTPSEEGSSIMQLPDGVYGFTYAPAIAAPLFASFRYRAFEMHRKDGEPFIVGFLSAAEAERLRTSREPFDVVLRHDLSGDNDTIVAVPYARIIRHRQYSAHNTVGLELKVGPAVQSSASNTNG